MPSTAQPFQSQSWLRQHTVNVLNFYYPDCVDHRYGGYIAQLSDEDGHIYDGQAKHTVATCRFVYSFSLGAQIDGPDWCRSVAAHGLRFLMNDHWDDENGGFVRELSGRTVRNPNHRCYDHAFGLLAASTAAEAGIDGAEAAVERIYDVIDERFWEPEHNLCAIDASPDWSETDSYRGQNSNMHTCEAHLAAYEATGEARYLDRSYAIAEALGRELADETDGLIWEHYTEDWEHDFEYHRDESAHTFRPWGYQPGHLLEWSKLLAQLARHRDEEWLVERAAHLFDAAVEYGWDDEHGGFIYTFDRDGEPLVLEKYYWPHTEGVGAAALLAEHTGEDRFWEWYDQIWAYAWRTLVNKKYGNWYFKRTRTGEPHDGIDGTPEFKVGYHQVGACVTAMDVLNRLAAADDPPE